MTLKFSTCAILCFALLTTRSDEKSIVGVGISLGRNPGADGLVVSGVVPAGPAYNAGVKTGWSLLKIDQIDVTGKKLEECITLIRGKEGTKVRMEFLDDAKKSTNRFTIVREKIVIK